MIRRLYLLSTVYVWLCFVDLRLHLLEVERNHYLVRALYGLLMILPQSEAFLLLKHRLDCVPNYYNKIAEHVRASSSCQAKDPEQAKKLAHEIDFNQLLQHFVQVQETHRFFKKSKRISME